MNRVVFLLLALLVVAGVWVATRHATSAPNEVVSWVRENARPFDTTDPTADLADLAALDSIVGDANLVGLGECTHGSREVFQMKHRIVEYLVTRKGFRTFAIEANMPEAARVNEYVLTGQGIPRELIRGMYFWTWQTQEVLALVEWMRAFNASARGPVQFAGFDMQTPDTAAAIVRRFVERVEPAYLDSVDATWRLVTRSRSNGNAFDTATATFPVTEAAGHRIEFSGSIRTKNVTGFAGLWWRADTPERPGAAFSNMMEQQIAGTRDWKRYSLTLDVPPNTSNINFGMLLSGRGTAWFDSLEIRIDGRPWSGKERFDLAMEDPDGPGGFSREHDPTRYRIAMDDAVAASGRRSLRISSLPTNSARERAGYESTQAATARTVAHLSAELPRFSRATSEAEARWALQNARIVAQAASLDFSGERLSSSFARDSCMAANVGWILEQAPGEKIVLWAHNSHVSRAPGWMGEHLHRRYGRNYVPIGFTTARGTYRAVDGTVREGNPLTAPPAMSLENALMRAGRPRFFLDLRRANGKKEVADWLAQYRPMRGIGAKAQMEQFRHTRVSRWYDAIVWIDSTSSAVPLPGSMRP
jgi:erythromycin esterase-like protein